MFLLIMYTISIIIEFEDQNWEPIERRKVSKSTKEIAKELQRNKLF